MIDSHCHLNFPSLSKDLDNVLKKCKNNGVTKLLTINTKPIEFEEHLNLIKDFDDIFIGYQGKFLMNLSDPIVYDNLANY